MSLPVRNSSGVFCLRAQSWWPHNVYSKEERDHILRQSVLGEFLGFYIDRDIGRCVYIAGVSDIMLCRRRRRRILDRPNRR